MRRRQFRTRREEHRRGRAPAARRTGEQRGPQRNRTFDEYGDLAKLDKLIPQIRNAESVVVTGADHFFTKRLEAVEVLEG